MARHNCELAFHMLIIGMTLCFVMQPVNLPHQILGILVSVAVAANVSYTI